MFITVANSQPTLLTPVFGKTRRAVITSPQWLQEPREDKYLMVGNNELLVYQV